MRLRDAATWRGALERERKSGHTQRSHAPAQVSPIHLKDSARQGRRSLRCFRRDSLLGLVVVDVAAAAEDASIVCRDIEVGAWSSRNGSVRSSKLKLHA